MSTFSAKQAAWPSSDIFYTGQVVVFSVELDRNLLVHLVLCEV